MTASSPTVSVHLLADHPHQVWVATGGRAIAFYERHGWRLFEIVEDASGEATVLRKPL